MTTTRDDAFHEIQLNGKQLFFLFMAATVVSVVIFLCGVLVGRGVRAERSLVAEHEALSSSPMADAPSAIAPPAEPTTDLTVVPPPPPVLEDDLAAIEPVKPNPATPKPAAAPPAAVAKPSTPPPSVQPAPAPTTTAAAATTARGVNAPAVPGAGALVATSSPASGADGGWTVQVAAVTTRPDADSVVKALSSKGYPAFVVDPQAGTMSYRVRVGNFKTKREAETLADKLSKEPRYNKTWVTR